jgi:outer membrane protein OmpA-like peptidoglycan-associated protein
MIKTQYLLPLVALSALTLSACSMFNSSSQSVSSSEATERSVAENTQAPPYIPVYHTVLFAFDSFEAPAGLNDLVSPHIQYLKQNPDRVVLLQGTTDEVGEPPYNYELGKHRAQTVKQAFVDAGISPERIRTTSIASAMSSRATPRAVHIVY